MRMRRASLRHQLSTHVPSTFMLLFPAQDIVFVRAAFWADGWISAGGAIRTKGPNCYRARDQEAGVRAGGGERKIEAILGFIVVGEADCHDIGVTPRVPKNAI